MFASPDRKPSSSSDVRLAAFAPAQQAGGCESPLTAQEIAVFREHMQHLRDWLRASIEHWEQRASNSPSDRLVAFSAANVDADWERAIAQGAVANKRLMLNDIMRAFDRIREQTYGRCEADNASIPRTLLEQTPWVRYCPSCACRQGE